MAQQFDWNLLVALDVLLAESSVTEAAARLHLSIPATSRTLSRIRTTFNDPILVRAGRGLTPTPRALAIQQRLHQLIEEAHSLVATGPDVDLASLQRAFVIRANDALINVLSAPLLAQVRRAAPGVTLRFAAEGNEDLAPLRNGLIDIDLGVISDMGPEIRVQPLHCERQLGMVAANHPLSQRRITLRRLAAVQHVAVSRRGRSHGVLDDILEKHGLTRTVAVVVPTFSAAADLIAGSELTGLINARFARQFAARTGVYLYDIPAPTPAAQISQAWHVRHDLDPAHSWLRNQIASILTNRRSEPETAAAPLV